MRKIMAVLDVGNDATKIVVGEVIKDKVNVLATSCIKTLGLKKFDITSEDKLLETLKKAFKDINDKLNMTIKKVIVIVPSKDIEFTIGEATINITNEDNIIKGRDVSKVINETTSGIIQDNMELINTLPTNFKIDNKDMYKDPKGIKGNTLNLKSIVITSPKSNVYPILSLLEKLNIDIVDISLDAIGDYYAFKDDDMTSNCGAVVNIGHQKTTISIFSKGLLTNVKIIDLGGLNIDNDLSYIYKINDDVARKLKENLVTCDINLALSSDTLEVINNDGAKLMVNQYDVSKIANSRLNEILEIVKRDLTHLTKKELKFIMFTGGVSEIDNFENMINDKFGHLASIGRIKNLGVRNNKYSSAFGLIKWYNDLEKLKDKDYSIFSIEEQEDLSGIQNQDHIDDNSVIGKVFGYFFDN